MRYHLVNMGYKGTCQPVRDVLRCNVVIRFVIDNEYRLLPENNHYITNKRFLTYCGLPETTEIVPGTLLNIAHIPNKTNYTCLFKGTYLRTFRDVMGDGSQQIYFVSFNLCTNTLMADVFHITHFTKSGNDSCFDYSRHEPYIRIQILSNFNQDTKNK